MTLSKKIITYYTLTILLISSLCYTTKINGAEDCSQIKWGVSTRQGLREEMEDRYSVEERDGVHFFGVYDGHGGAGAAEFVQKNLCENFFKARYTTIKERLTNAFLKTDNDFLNDPKFKNDDSGTTAVVAEVDAGANELLIANAGDSRIIMVREGKKLFATDDHKPDVKSECERIKKAKGFVYRSRVNGVLAVSRAIGDRTLKEWVISNPDTHEESFKKNDILVLASDGLWDVMDSEEVAGFVHERLNKLDQESSAANDSVQDTGEEVQDTGEEVVDEDGDKQMKLVARALRDKAYEKESRDNIAVLLVKLGAFEGITAFGTEKFNESGQENSETDNQTENADNESMELVKKNSSLSARLFKLIRSNKNIVLGLGGVVAMLYALHCWGFFSSS